MGLRKMLAQVIKDNKEIKESLNPEVIRKAQEYDRVSALLKNVKVHVSKVAKTMDAKGNEAFIVHYEIPPEIVSVDEDGGMVCSETFRSINFLGLLSVEDEFKISEKILKKAK